MIIPQDSPLPKRDDPPRPQQQIPSTPPQNSSLESPPPYSNNQANSQYIVPAAFVEPRVSAERRFFRAIFVAVSIWVLAGIFIFSVDELHKTIHWVRKSVRWNAMKDNIGIPKIDIKDGHVDKCALWTRVSGSEHQRLSPSASGTWSQARLDLPTDADGLYLLARGARASGDLYVRESHEANNVSVTVFVYHRDEGALSHATVCRLSRDDGQAGVGIFSSLSRRMPWYIRGSDLRFVVEVRLPPSHGAVRYIPSLHADLPMFALAMGDLSAFRFGDVTLKSSNKPIKSEGFVSNSLKISSMNGAIIGNFNTTNSLKLITTNSPVSVRVGAENEESQKPTEVVIQTDNAPIEADITLTSKSSPGTGGTFGVHARTTNGPVTIVYHDSPVDSVLNFGASSTNSPIHAVLHDAYEGKFSLLTTNANAVLDHLRDVEDPSGLGRERRLLSHSVNKQGHGVYGEVEWSPSRSDGRAGSVDIKTTNKLIKLSI